MELGTRTWYLWWSEDDGQRNLERAEHHMRASRVAIIAALAAALGTGCREGRSSPVEPGPEPDEAAVAGPITFVQVSAGGAHACGTATDGRAWCWGWAGTGQLGFGGNVAELCLGNIPCSKTPILVSGGLRFRHVTAGNDFTCGVTTADRVYCWGINDRGQLGNNTPPNMHASPGEISGNRRYRQVRAGGQTACAITNARLVFCWGSNSRGQLGIGTTTDSRVPVKVQLPALEWAVLTVGNEHACVVATDGRSRCWGFNLFGTLGDGTDTERHLPVPVAGGLRFDMIEAGSANTCGVTTEGRGYCWGGGLGIGDGGEGLPFRLSPVPITGDRKFVNVSAGFGTSCGVTRADRGLCWGRNGGALGNSKTADALVPSAVSGNLSFKAISVATGGFSCGVTTGGRAWCWGHNGFGSLGDGTDIDRSVPVQVANP
jgi:alpha-tubulin suppressor-like RCC1 family protein